MLSACRYLHWNALLGPHYQDLKDREQPCLPAGHCRCYSLPSVVEVVFVRFGPAAPAVGVSRRDNHSREQRTRTYSREGTQTFVLPHMNMPNCQVMNDVQIEEVVSRSTAVAAAGGTAQMRTMWQTIQERLAQVG